MKDIQFEETRRALTLKQRDLKQKRKGKKQLFNVKIISLPEPQVLEKETKVYL